MWRSFTAAALLAAAGTTTPSPDAASLASDAAHILASERHGAIAFALAYRYEEHGPGHNVVRSANALVLRDGASVVKTRVLDGAAAKPTLVEDDYHLPIETNYLTEYQFSSSQAACEQCTSTAAAVDFVSLRRDDAHGDGTMWIDGPSHHVLALRFHPSVLPPHADSGDVRVSFGQVLPDLWDVSVTEQQYTGHKFIFHGWGHVQQRQSTYRRFTSIAAGITALSAAEPDAANTSKPKT